MLVQVAKQSHAVIWELNTVLYIDLRLLAPKGRDFMERGLNLIILSLPQVMGRERSSIT